MFEVSCWKQICSINKGNLGCQCNDIFFSLYLARQREAFVKKNLGYPEVQRGKGAPIPPYDPLGDPHLAEYFERRFGAIQSVARVCIRNKKKWIRVQFYSFKCLLNHSWVIFQWYGKWWLREIKQKLLSPVILFRLFESISDHCKIKGVSVLIRDVIIFWMDSRLQFHVY